MLAAHLLQLAHRVRQRAHDAVHLRLPGVGHEHDAAGGQGLGEPLGLRLRDEGGVAHGAGSDHGAGAGARGRADLPRRQCARKWRPCESATSPEAVSAIDWDALDAMKYTDEDTAVAALLADLPLDSAARASVAAEARALVTKARGLKRRKGVMESFLEEFGLSNAEGLALMCLAEALLRVPDEETADKLIAEKIRTGKWGEHLGKSDHWLVNAGTWGLMLTGHVVNLPDDMRGEASSVIAKHRQALGRAGRAGGRNAGDAHPRASSSCSGARLALR